eukprot:m.135356 g.135356  ORF g.135356 m.135356 type:complete len:225 (-) comp9941_c0_seq1:136-810(-)
MALNPRFAAEIQNSNSLYVNEEEDDDFNDDLWDNMEEDVDYDNFNTEEVAEEYEEDAQGGYLGVEPDGEYDEARASAPGDKEESGYLAVNPDWLEEQWKLLAVQPWFRGDETYNREDATRELSKTDPGSFVVRVSISQPGHYAISTKTKAGKIVSMLILPSWAGPNSNAPGQTQYRLGSTSKLLFNTVPKLIQYFCENNYYRGDSLKGDVIPEKQEGGYMLLAP